MVEQHKEVLELCTLHVEEIEKMEKRRGQEGFASDRDLLLANGGTGKAIEFIFESLTNHLK